jgi:hypothetical protein
MTTTYKIEKFENLIEIGTTLGKNWYRGHSKAIGELTPGIFREEFTNEFYLSLNPQPEFRIAEDFKRKAPSIERDLPKFNNHIEWLFIMQHHGVPTRLLDWSENILIACFFAVTSNQNEDGELWTFLPWKLNENHGFYGLPTIGNKQLQFLSHEIFHNKPENLAEQYGLSETPKIPMALLPSLTHPRMTAQQSCFTIHPKPEKGYSIPEVMTDEKFLVRYIIPKELKKEIEMKIKYLGITYSRIFPDLDGLAKTLRQNERFIGWGQPKPIKYEKIE